MFEKDNTIFGLLYYPQLNCCTKCLDGPNSRKAERVFRPLTFRGKFCPRTSVTAERTTQGTQDGVCQCQQTRQTKN